MSCSQGGKKYETTGEVLRKKSSGGINWEKLFVIVSNKFSKTYSIKIEFNLEILRHF